MELTKIADPILDEIGAHQFICMSHFMNSILIEVIFLA